MPQEPKKRHSRQRQGKRRASIHLSLSHTVTCPNCQTEILAHQICPKCGFYKGREVISMQKKEDKKKKREEETKENTQQTTK
ncbi:MAG: 50S ribosomal protein L32 [Candidatus Levybacteria bacterium]|nr:50S ribosomal protein L32 [Candidatus Levybacteria bacterium]